MQKSPNPNTGKLPTMLPAMAPSRSLNVMLGDMASKLDD